MDLDTNDVVHAISMQTELCEGLREDLQKLLEVQRRALDEMEELTHSIKVSLQTK